MGTRYLSAVLLAAALLAPGCFSTTYLKSAEVVPPAGFSITLGGMAGDDGAAVMGEIRAGLIPRLDIGLRNDTLTTAVDVRLQALVVEEGAPFDCSVELGVGMSGFTVSRYAGICVSRDLGGITPILGYRYVDGTVDEDDIDDEGSEFAEEIIRLLLVEAFPAHQVFAGFELELGRRVSLVPEVMYIPNFDDYVQVNLGLRVKLW